MPLPFRLARRAGPLGLALTAYDLWRRLSPRQRRMLMESARKHGPRVASAAVRRARPRSRGEQPRP